MNEDTPTYLTLVTRCEDRIDELYGEQNRLQAELARTPRIRFIRRMQLRGDVQTAFLEREGQYNALRLLAKNFPEEARALEEARRERRYATARQ